MKLKRAVIGPVLVASVAFVSGGWLMQREVTGQSGIDSRIFDEVLSRVELFLGVDVEQAKEIVTKVLEEVS